MMHIIKVEFCNAKHLNALHFSLKDKIAVGQQFVPWAQLCTLGISALESKEEVKDNITIFSHKLIAFLPKEVKMPSPLAIRITTATGQKFIIGSSGRPFPEVVQTNTLAARPSERSGVSLSISYTGTNPLFEVLE